MRCFFLKRGASKKGLNQVEWVISLSIFVIYLIWFFVIVRPSLYNSQTTDTFKDNLRDEIEEYASFDVKRIPVKIISSIKDDDVGFVIDGMYEEESNMYLEGRYFDIFDDKLIFLKDVNATDEMIDVISSYENYTKDSPYYDFHASESSFRTSNMIVEINNGIIRDVDYRSEDLVLDQNIYSKGESIDSWEKMNQKSEISSSYKIIHQIFNLTTILFAENTKIYNSWCITEGDSSKLVYDLGEFDSYYSDYYNNRIFTDDEDRCDSMIRDFVSFYNDDIKSSLTFVFDKNVTVNVCNKNTSQISISFTANKDVDFWTIIHRESYQRGIELKKAYRIIKGKTITVSGISRIRLLDLLNSDYTQLKQRFNYPDAREFRIVARNIFGNATLEVGATPYDLATVKSEELGIAMLDKYGNIKDFNIYLQRW